MFKRCILLVLISFFSTAYSRAEDAKLINVLVSCPQGEQSLEDFLSFVKKQLKLPSDTTTSTVKASESLSVATPQIDVVEQSNFARLSVPVENVLAYMQNRADELSKMTGVALKNSPKAPQNAWDVFYDFQMMTAGECDFLIPTRAKFLDKKALESL